MNTLKSFSFEIEHDAFAKYNLQQQKHAWFWAWHFTPSPASLCSLLTRSWANLHGSLPHFSQWTPCWFSPVQSRPALLWLIPAKSLLKKASGAVTGSLFRDPVSLILSVLLGCPVDPSTTFYSPTPCSLILTPTLWFGVPLSWSSLTAVDFWFSKAQPALWLTHSLPHLPASWVYLWLWTVVLGSKP